MKFLSSIESWNSFFEWASVVLVAGTVIAGAGAILTSRVINKRQEGKIRELDIKRLELEAKLAPRRLTGNQKSTLSKFLADDPGAVVIVSSLLDAESSDFADDFDSALRDAHWQTLRIRNHTTLEYGVSVGTFEGTQLGDTKRLSDALTSIEIAHRDKTFGAEDKQRMSPYFEAGVLYLVIDKKPPQTEK